jgi:hypothetical protein
VVPHPAFIVTKITEKQLNMPAGLKTACRETLFGDPGRQRVFRPAACLPCFCSKKQGKQAG